MKWNHNRYDGDRSFGVKAVVDAILTHGPMTREQVSAATGLDKNLAAGVCRRLSKPLSTMPKRLYIVRYERHSEFGKSYIRPVYDVGSYPDAPKPPRVSNNERVRRWRATKKPVPVVATLDQFFGIKVPNGQTERPFSYASRRHTLQDDEDSAS